MRLSLEDRIEADRIVCAMHVHLPSEIPWLTADEVLSVAPVRIPVNVTADSGNVTGIPANVTEGRCCAF
jgi:hypothetical protein